MAFSSITNGDLRLGTTACEHMATHGYDDAHGFNRNSADNKCGTFSGVGKQENGCEREKESGRHDQQSSVFHGPFLSNHSSDEDDCVATLYNPRLSQLLVDVGLASGRGPQREERCGAEGNRLKCLQEF